MAHLRAVVRTLHRTLRSSYRPAHLHTVAHAISWSLCISNHSTYHITDQCSDLSAVVEPVPQAVLGTHQRPNAIDGCALCLTPSNHEKPHRKAHLVFTVVQAEHSSVNQVDSQTNNDRTDDMPTVVQTDDLPTVVQTDDVSTVATRLLVVIITRSVLLHGEQRAAGPRTDIDRQ